MAEKGVPLPKFGDWDENDPASAEGFTVIFAKAKDEKNSQGNASKNGGADKNKNKNAQKQDYSSMSKKWFCCF